METTPRWGHRYPELTGDLPDVPLWMQRLAEDLDDVAKDDQGAVGSRPTSTPGSPGKKGRYYWATDERVLYRDNGAGWDRVNKPVYVTSLPGSPVDGDEVFFEAAAGVVWHLRYRAGASGSFKWEFVGGADLWSMVETQQSRADSDFGALATPGPSLTVPLAGDYDIFGGASMDNANDGLQNAIGLSINGATPGAADQFGVITAVGTPDPRNAAARRWRKTGLAASTTLAFVYSTQNNGTGWFRDRHLAIRPVRVGS